MSYEEKEFTNEIKKLRKRYNKHKPHWYSWKDWDIERAWNIYTNTRTSILSTLILGHRKIRDLKIQSSRELTWNFGTTSDQENIKGIELLKKNLAKRKLSVPYTKLKKNLNFKEHLTRGSILNELEWWPLPNDAWLIGGVHGLRSFHLGQDPADDLLWDKKGYPRVLARELIGLYRFGYKLIKHDHLSSLGYVFAPVDSEIAVNAKFSDYLDEIEKYDSKKKVVTFWKAARKGAIDYDKYSLPNL